MSQSTKKESNRVVGYLSPYHVKLVKAYAKYTGQSNSDVVAEAIKAKFNTMPIQEREMILNFGK